MNRQRLVGGAITTLFSALLVTLLGARVESDVPDAAIVGAVVGVLVGIWILVGLWPFRPGEESGSAAAPQLPGLVDMSGNSRFSMTNSEVNGLQFGTMRDQAQANITNTVFNANPTFGPDFVPVTPDEVPPELAQFASTRSEMWIPELDGKWQGQTEAPPAAFVRGWWVDANGQVIGYEPNGFYDPTIEPPASS